MERLCCDKPYNLDEARQKKGLPKRKRKDPKSVAYELTIRVPQEYQPLFQRKKLTRTVFATGKRDLKNKVAEFENEKTETLKELLSERDMAAKEDPIRQEPRAKKEPSHVSIGEFAKQYIEIRSNGSVSVNTLDNEKRFLRYVDASIGDIPIDELTADDIERCLLEVPIHSKRWAEERLAKRKKNRKVCKWAKEHKSLLKPLQEPRAAGPDMQAKVLKFLRETLNYAMEKDLVMRNVAKARFLSRIFKKSRPRIDPLMADEAARFLKEVKLLPTGFFKLALLLLLDTGMRPEEVRAIRPGSFRFGENETRVTINGAARKNSNGIDDYLKSDASRRTVPIDSYTAQVAKDWIAIKCKTFEEAGMIMTMNTPLISPLNEVFSYTGFKANWDKFVKRIGFEGMRPYALRHTYATLNLANGENIKTVSVLMGHASSAYTLDLYAGYVPSTGIGLGERYMRFLRMSAEPFS